MVDVCFTTDVSPGDRLVLPPNETTAEFEDVLRSYDACVKLVDQMKKIVDQLRIWSTNFQKSIHSKQYLNIIDGYKSVDTCPDVHKPSLHTGSLIPIEIYEQLLLDLVH